MLARAEQANISTNLNKAMESYSSGDVGEAKVLLNNQIATTTAANKDLKSSELDKIVGRLKRQLRASEQAAPSSPAGKALIKGGKFDAYNMAK